MFPCDEAKSKKFPIICSKMVDGDHLIMEMIIILLTHQMSSYPSPASHLYPQPYPSQWLLFVVSTYLSTRYLYLRRFALCSRTLGKVSEMKVFGYWLRMLYVMLNVMLNVMWMSAIFISYTFYGKLFSNIHVCSQFEYFFFVFLGTDLSLYFELHVLMIILVYHYHRFSKIF